MKKTAITLAFVLLLVFVAELFRVSGDFYKGAYPKVPTITVFNRTDAYETTNFDTLVLIAVEAGFGKTNPLALGFERILIVEEPEYWVVAFLFRGNQILEPARFFGVPIWETILVGELPIVYVEKDTNKVLDAPTNDPLGEFHYHQFKRRS